MAYNAFDAGLNVMKDSRAVVHGYTIEGSQEA
jgi:hypothetical protein